MIENVNTFILKKNLTLLFGVGMNYKKGIYVAFSIASSTAHGMN